MRTSKNSAFTRKREIFLP